jgi:hypothetical protein
MTEWDKPKGTLFGMIDSLPEPRYSWATSGLLSRLNSRWSLRYLRFPA